MTKPYFPIETLKDLAQKEVEKAALQLGYVHRIRKQTDDNLSLLLDYQNEYRNKLNCDMSDGIDLSRWHNYQQFITTLGKAIQQHKGQLAQLTVRAEQALQCLQEKQQRLCAWQTLQARAEAKIRQQENRLDQKRMDEFAQRASLRKGE